MNQTHEPFSREVDEISFFPYPKLTDAVIRIRRLMEGGHHILLLTGPEGSGKSLAVKQILAMDEASWHVATLSLPIDGRPLKVYSMSRDELPIVVVDDAHLLEPETIASLIKLTSDEQDERSLKQILFTGTAKLANQIDTLRHLLPPRDAIMEVPLPPMDLEETHTYIAGHLRSCGMRGELPLTDGQVERIHTLSKGFPGAVNTQTIKALAEIPGPAEALPQRKGLFGRLFGK